MKSNSPLSTETWLWTGSKWMAGPVPGRNEDSLFSRTVMGSKQPLVK